MFPLIRVCFIQISLFYQLDKQFGDPSRESLFSGSSSRYQNEFGSIISHGLRGNFSYVGKDHHDGCIKSLLQNESDVLQSYAPYGKQDFNRIFPIVLWSDGAYSIHSVYNMTSPDTKMLADIGSSAIFGLKGWVYAMVIVLLFFCYLLLSGTIIINAYPNNIRRRRHVIAKRLRQRLAFDMVSHFLRQGSIDLKNGRLVCLLISVTSFYILVSMGNVLTTELVVVDRPHIIQKFDDILRDPTIKVGTANTFSTDEDLMLFGPNSRNGKFWLSVRNRKVQVLTSSTSMGDIVSLANDAVKQKIIVLLPATLDDQMHQIICKFYPLIDFQSKGFVAYHYYDQDPDSERIPVSYVMTQSFRRTWMGKRFIDNNYRGFEAGLFHKMTTFVNLDGITPSTNGVRDRGEDRFYRICMYGDRIVMPDVPITPSVNILNLLSVFKVGLALFYVAIFSLFIEWYRGQMSRMRDVC